MRQEENLDFNFWAAFADLMLALVLVLCLLLFLVMAVISTGTVNLKQVELNQQTMIDSIASYYKTEYKSDNRQFKISTENNGIFDIEIENDLNSQRITFSDKLLFRPDDVVINSNGRAVLGAVGKTLKNQLEFIREIQIQGHADTLRSARFASNTELAAMRGIEVFKYLKDEIKIDPAIHLMSVTSFGEFRSVKRERTNTYYDQMRLDEDNSTEERRSKNRRIEILLIYRR